MNVEGVTPTLRAKQCLRRRGRAGRRLALAHPTPAMSTVPPSPQPFFARDGCTRFGSPGIFGKFGGYGASPSPAASSRSTHS
jgi:hypothetical protein